MLQNMLNGVTGEELDLFLNDAYPLHKAAREGNSEIMRCLIKKGLSVNKATFDLVCPLHEASFMGNYDCIKILLENGAEVNARNIDGSPPLADACATGKDECVTLLLENGAHVNPKLLLTSPLHEAVLRDNVCCVKLLIEAGASLHSTDLHYGTPLHVAASRGYIQCAEILLRAGAPVNAKKTHHTALHEVARQMDIAFLQLLLNHGACIGSIDNHGRQAEDMITSSTSPAKQLLQEWAGNPRSLKHFCRLAIRNILGTNGLKILYQLHLPKLLLDYLDFR